MTLLKKIVGFAVIILFWACENATSKKGELIDFIPENPSVVLKISNFETLQRDTKTNSFLSAFDKTKPYSFFSEKAAILKHLKPSSPGILCVNTPTDSTTAYTFITRESSNLFETDSIKDKTIETLAYDKISLQRIITDKQIAFTAVKDSVFILSSSQLVLQQILEGKTEKDPTFKKIATINNESDLTTILKNTAVTFSDSITTNFASWMALETEILPDAITATGVVLARDSVPQLLSVFEGQIPQKNEIARVIPNEALGAVSFTFNNPEKLQKNLQDFRKDEVSDSVFDPLFESVNEVGSIQLKEGNVIILKSIDPMLTKESLLKYVSENNAFREVTISTFNASGLFTEVFSPLVPSTAPEYTFQLDDFFVFTETISSAEQIITAYKNNSCLSKALYFEDASSQLSTSSSLLIYKMNDAILKGISNFFTSETVSQLENVSLKKYPFAALQFSHDRDFAHVNMVCKEASKGILSPGGISQRFSLNLDNEMLGDPQLFSNHRTGGKDIVVQDITNKLYLISESGKVLWTKNLESPILGKVHAVDLLRNGKKQLAFTTKNTFHILDRNGKPVAPFPLKFRDDITQPLSVFDYDNNRKYRFVITQGKEVFMYNSKGKIVTGFTFKKTRSDIVLPPQHLRMENKDYLLIAESDGTLNILSRVGKTRVNVSESFQFSEIPVAEESNQFVVITKDHIKKSISQNGKIASQKLNVSNSYYFTIKGNTKATLDDNLLRINGKLTELPYGIYTSPKVFNVNRNTYISVTEIQENKVYIFNASGALLQGFPVYGTSSVDIGNASNKKRVNLVVKGSEKEVLLYQIQ